MTTITKNSAVSISLMITIIGAVICVSKVYFLSDANAKTLEKVVSQQDSYTKDVAAIRQDIAVIKTILQEENR